LLILAVLFLSGCTQFSGDELTLGDGDTGSPVEVKEANDVVSSFAESFTPAEIMGADEVKINSLISKADSVLEKIGAALLVVTDPAEKQGLEQNKSDVSGVKSELEKALALVPKFKEPVTGKSAVDFEKAKQIVLGEVVNGADSLVFSKKSFLLLVQKFTSSDQKKLILLCGKLILMFSFSGLMMSLRQSLHIQQDLFL